MMQVCNFTKNKVTTAMSGSKNYARGHGTLLKQSNERFNYHSILKQLKVCIGKGLNIM